LIDIYALCPFNNLSPKKGNNLAMEAALVVGFSLF